MGNIQSCIASKQPVSAEDREFKPWIPGEGEIGDLDLGGGKEAIIPACFWGYCSETTGGLSLQREVYRLGSKGLLK